MSDDQYPWDGTGTFVEIPPNKSDPDWQEFEYFFAYEEPAFERPRVVSPLNVALTAFIVGVIGVHMVNIGTFDADVDEAAYSYYFRSDSKEPGDIYWFRVRATDCPVDDTATTVTTTTCITSDWSERP
jgi:hypothetical protein